MRREKGRPKFSPYPINNIARVKCWFSGTQQANSSSITARVDPACDQDFFIVGVIRMGTKAKCKRYFLKCYCDGSIIAWMFKSDAFCVCARRIRAWHSSVTSSPPTIGGVDRFRNSAVRIRKLKSTAAEES
jgi:hypothetical protein